MTHPCPPPDDGREAAPSRTEEWRDDIAPLIPYYVNSTLSEGAAARVHEHILDCAGCRAEHHEWQAIAEAALLLPAPLAPRNVPNAVWAALGIEVPRQDADRTPAEDLALKAHIEQVLSTLSSREREVLALRFGLEDGQARTLEEVAREFGVPRERIRQIEAKALRKLRSSRSSQSTAGDAPGRDQVGQVGAAPRDEVLGGLQRLSPREREVLCLVARGQRDREIALELGITVRTVTTMIARILEKLPSMGWNRASAAAYAIAKGLCTDD